MPTNQPLAFLALASRFENIELVQAVLDDLLTELDLGEDARHWIGLAVREAVANAIRHGNEADPDRHVEVDLGTEDEEVVIRVRDQGPGFELDDVGDPLDPDNLLKPGGRGIFYMRSLMDTVDYRFDAPGTEVVMRKRVNSEEANR